MPSSTEVKGKILEHCQRLEQRWARFGRPILERVQASTGSVYYTVLNKDGSKEKVRVSDHDPVWSGWRPLEDSNGIQIHFMIISRPEKP